jgi:Nucleotidyltransferase domain
MNSEEAFDRFGRAIETDPLDVLLARWRRDAFTTRLRRLPGVVQVIHSGSLARGTHVGQIHDVDIIVVFDAAACPGWDRGSGSAAAALEDMRAGIDKRLGSGQGPFTRLVQRTELRNHVVRCQDVSLGPLDDIIPSGPPVDVMPALRVGSHLRVPGRRRDRWDDVDPEKLMRLVEERKREWKYFDEAVRMVKVWAERSHLNMQSVAIEVLVLKYLPRPRFFETLSCGEAMARFFEAAARANIHMLSDPAGRCGEIDPGMNYGALRAALTKAAGLARQAVDAERAIENPNLAEGAIEDPNHFWRKIFGRKFPYARKRLMHRQYHEPLSAPAHIRYLAEHPERVSHRAEGGRGGWPFEGPSTPPDDGTPRPPRPDPHPPSPPGTGDGYDPPPKPAEPVPDGWEEIFEQGGATITIPVTFG